MRFFYNSPRSLWLPSGAILSHLCSSPKNGKPLLAFAHREDAEGAAEEMRLRDGRPWCAYPCRKCRHWHLSPVPKIPCTFCRLCGKEGYYSKENAEKMASRLYVQEGVMLRSYKCDKGSGRKHGGIWRPFYHLTKKKVSAPLRQQLAARAGRAREFNHGVAGAAFNPH